MHIDIHASRNNPFSSEYISELTTETIGHKIAQCLESAGDFEVLVELNDGVVFTLSRQESQGNQFIAASAKVLIETIRNNFELAQQSEDPVKIELANHPGLVKKVSYNKSMYFSGFYYALIFRSEKFKEYLSAIDFSKYLVTYTEFDMFNICHSDVLRGLGKEKKVDLLRKFNIGYKHLMKIKREKTIQSRIFYPLWEYIITEQNGIFNERLEAALYEHKKYWSSSIEDPDIDNDPSGHRNLFLTGIMSYAEDIGFPVLHTSDYTPQYLIKANCRVDLGAPTEYMYEPRKMSAEELQAYILKKLGM